MRIELLRMRAGYERLETVRSACQLAHSLRPEALVVQARDRLSAQGLGWLADGLRLVRRHPLLLSLLSAAVTDARRRRMLLRASLGAWLAWRWFSRRRRPEA